MNNDIQTIDTNNYAQMAKAMGIAGETGSADTSKANPLPRMRLHHNNIMGIKKVGDQSIDAVVVKGGSFKLERPDLPVRTEPNSLCFPRLFLSVGCRVYSSTSTLKRRKEVFEVVSE